MKVFVDTNVLFSAILFPKSMPDKVSDELMIRDVKDRPVLRSAIESCADIIITGDKDLLEAGIKHPTIITASDFYKNF